MPCRWSEGWNGVAFFFSWGGECEIGELAGGALLGGAGAKTGSCFSELQASQALVAARDVTATV